MAKLYFRYSTMNAGKSLELLSVAHNYESNNKKVAIYNYAKDNRFGTGVVASRLGISKPAIMFDADMDWGVELAQYFTNKDLGCVLIDEAQFLTIEQVKQIHKVVHQLQISVICYGLRSDFKGNFFEGSAMLLTLADDIAELKTICACGKKATMNIRFNGSKRVKEGSVVEIGDANYKPVCGDCFYKL